MVRIAVNGLGRIGRAFVKLALARPELDRLRDDSSKGLFALILINDVDRLARDVTHLGVIKRDLERHGVQVRLLLAKNPAGWLEAFDVLEPRPAPVLLSVNAREPDGRDTSWLWDVDYRVLRGRPVFVSGERRLDLAVRLEADLVAFDLVDGVDEAVDQVEGTSLDVIANYTAFQQIRVALGRAD